MRTMSVRLPDEVFSKLERRADELKVAPAVLARMLLNQSLGPGDIGDQLLKEQQRGQERREMGGPRISRGSRRRRSG